MSSNWWEYPTLNLPYDWGRDTLGKLPSPEFLANLPPGLPSFIYQKAEDIAMRRVGYIPSYFEHPQNLVEAYQKWQSLPKGVSAPDWLDTDKLDQAYQYLKYSNQDKPWTEWSYLNPKDVLGRSLLQSLGTPPVQVMSPSNAKIYGDAGAVMKGEMNWSDLAPDSRAKLLSDPTFDIAKYPWQIRSQIIADPNWDWSKLPAWQKTYYGVMSSPFLPMAMAALPAGIIGSMLGPWGTAIGVGAGAYAGWKASQGAYDITKEAWEQPTGIGGLFGWLNVPVEIAEKSIGFILQSAAVATGYPGAGKWEDLFKGISPFDKEPWAAFQAGMPGLFETAMPTAWQLATLKTRDIQEAYRKGGAEGVYKAVYEVLYHPKGTILGRAEPVPLPQGGLFNALINARKEVEAGANYRQVMLKYQQTVGSQVGDLFAQVVADPLNFLPRAEAVVTSKILEAKGHPTAAEAMGGARGIVEGIKTYATRVQTGMVEPGFKYNEMSGLSQFFAGIVVDAEGKPIIRAGKFAGTGLLEEPAKGFINYLSTLNPESRARLGLGMASENVLAIMSMFDDPEDMVTFWNKVRMGDYESAAAMSAHFVQSPEFYTILPAIKNYTMDGMINVWRASRPNAAVIERIAGLLGETGETIIKDLATPEAATRMFERLRNLVEASTDPAAKLLAEEITKGTFTPDDLVQAGKIFNGDARAPLTSAQWKATVADAITTHFAEWAKDFFHLQPDSAFFRTAAMLKSAQSLLLLGFNPTYALNNSMNNIISRLATGNFGYMTPGQIAAFIDRLGTAPYRLKEGVGMAGEVTTRAPERIITDALRAKGMIANAHDFLRSTGNKLGVFSNLSRWSEKVEGANACVSGIKRAWGQIWRLDKGYTRMDPGLVSALEAVHPGASRLIYDAIQAGMNQGEITRIVTQGTRELYTRSMVNNVAQTMGIDPAQAVTMLDQIGVLDDLDVRLAGVKSEAGIRSAFDASAKKAQDWIDVRLADEYETRASHIANRINTEGWQAVGDIYIDAELKVQERWLEHYSSFEEAFAQLDAIDDPVLRGNILESTYRTQGREWARVNQMELSTYKGLAEGLGLGELPEARDFLARKSDIQNLWGDAYKFRMDETAKYTDRFKDNWADPARYTERDSLQKRISQKFEAAFKEVQKNEKAMGNVFAAQFRQRFGETVGKMAAQYWTEITNFRARMWQEMQTFRKSLEGMTYDQRRAASQQFWHERYPVLIKELELKKVLGANEIHRTITGHPPEEGAAPVPVVPPPTEPTGGAGGIALTPAEKTAQGNIFTIANEFGIASADANGNLLFGANLHILAIVRKYGGSEGVFIKTFANLADKPDLVRAAFEQRRIVKNQQMPMPELATDAQMAEYQVVRNATATMDEHPELAAAAVVESEALKVPRENAGAAAAKAAENVIIEPARWSHIKETHIAMLVTEIRDALMYKAWDMMTMIEAGEPGRRLFNDGAFIGATKSSYPDWYGPLRRNKGDVLFALEALGKGLDKPEQGLYRSLKGIAAELLTSDPALLEKWEWAKAFGAENDILYRWDRSVDEIESTVRTLDIDDPFADKVIDFETLTELMDGLPEEVYDLVPEWKKYEGMAETYRDHINRVFDEAEAKNRLVMDRRAMLETLVSADKESAAVQQFRDMVMTRESFREQLIEQFGLPAEQADAQISVMDAQAQAWAKWTGKKPEAWYEQYLSQVVRGGEGELFQKFETLKELWGLPPEQAIERRMVLAKQALNDAMIGQPDYTPAIGHKIGEVTGTINASWLGDRIAEAIADYGSPTRGYKTSAAEDAIRQAVGWDRKSYALIHEFHDTLVEKSWFEAYGKAFDFPDYRTLLERRSKGEFLQEGLPPAIGAKGAISFTDQGKAIIHALDGADFTTAVHEIGGHLFPEILRQAVNDALPEFKPQLEADLRTLEDWAGIKEGGEWTTTGREKLARGFERYVTEGIAPLPALVRVFEQMKVWMLEIYKAIIGSAIDVKLTDEVRAVFDRMLGEEVSTPTKAYEGLRPGTPEWMDTWRAHPELQGEMAALASTLQNEVMAKAVEIAPAEAPTAPALYAAGDIVRLADGTQHTITEVRPDATLVVDNGQVVSVVSVQRMAAQVGMFGEKPPTQQTTLFQNVDPRTPLGHYEQASGWLPEGAMLDEAWSHFVQPLLDGMQNEALRRFREPTFSMGELDAPTQAGLTKYLNQKKGELATSKLAAVRYGESMRDFALLNYNRRYGFDKYLDVTTPYQFWYTRTMLNWGMRALDRPAWFANYARLNMAQNRYANNLPERMRGKIRFSFPWLPDWMGDELFIDPKRAVFPFFSMITPFEQMTKDQNYQVIEAERILQEWVQDESVPQTQVQEAWQKRSGAVWEKALAEAKIRRQSEVSDPLDFLSIMFGPAWYLSTPAKALGLNIPYINPQGGGPETISEVPLTRTARAMEAVTTGTWAEPVGQLVGLLGKPETWIRKQTGLPAYGEYGDYYVKRQITNMVSDGLISIQDAEQAMLERKGDIYDQARKRVELELAMRVPGAAATYAALHGGAKAGVETIPVSLFGAQILPAGELKYRGLYEKWNAAWDAYDAGDTSAINQFFNDHPEYEAYLAKNKDEGELLRSFLIGQIWDNYMAMDKNNRRMLLAQMPAMFEQSFLDKETRSYDAIDTETLAMWARVFKGMVPETPDTETVVETPQYQMPQLLEIPMPLQNALNAYNLAKTQNFPNINEVQSIYFALPKEKRRKILTLYPQLPAYWDWRTSYIEEHPEVAQFIDSDTMTAILNDEIAPMGMNADQAQKILRYYRTTYFDETPVRTYDYYMEKASGTLKMQFLDYVLRGTPLGSGAMQELISIWEANGKPQGTISNWVENLLIPTMP